MRTRWGIRYVRKREVSAVPGAHATSPGVHRSLARSGMPDRWRRRGRSSSRSSDGTAPQSPALMAVGGVVLVPPKGPVECDRGPQPGPPWPGAAQCVTSPVCLGMALSRMGFTAFAGPRDARAWRGSAKSWTMVDLLRQGQEPSARFAIEATRGATGARARADDVQPVSFEAVNPALRLYSIGPVPDRCAASVFAKSLYATRRFLTAS